MKIIDDDVSILPHHANLETRKKGWDEGSVYVPQGIIEVYAQGDEDNFYCTMLRFVYNGRLHIRTIHGKRYSHRGIVTLAKRYAHEIANQKIQETSS